LIFTFGKMKAAFAILLSFLLLSCEKDQVPTEDSLTALEGSKVVFHEDSLKLFSETNEDGEVHFWFRNYWPESKSFIYVQALDMGNRIVAPNYMKKPWERMDRGDERFDHFVGGFLFGNSLQNYLVKAVVIVEDTLIESQVMVIEKKQTLDSDLLEIDLGNPTKPRFRWDGGKQASGGYLHQLYDREGKLLTSMLWPSDRFDFYTVFDAGEIFLDDYAQPELIAGQRYRFEVYGLDNSLWATWHDSREFFAVENGLIDE